MHIGLIGGIGPAATEFYYRRMVRVYADTAPPATDTDAPLELTIAHADMTRMLANLGAGDPASQAPHFARHVDQLKAAGADLAAVTSVAGHFCFEELSAIASLPLVSLLDSVSEALAARGIRRIGLLGSRIAMESALYGTLSHLETVLPPGDALGAVSDAYFAMAGAAAVTEAQRALFFEAGEALCTRQGAEVVLLAGTDLFLAFESRDPGYPVLDCAELHVAALCRVARSESL